MDDRRDPILPLTFALISFPISNLEAHQEKDSSLKKSTVATFNLLSPQFHPAVSWLVALRGFVSSAKMVTKMVDLRSDPVTKPSG
ncbi:hypothetical protein L3X38_043223 [Prunus dulcis]|uniref:Uncharacterized protein n=1 Tax=Prunus dulcis TaxID=3755 RepID=A0AAD4YL18_PRUDU|nr:hypothetical protein L3X38_043223 [Prunus dulcis]